MVRVIIAFACVCLLSPTRIAFAQSGSSGSKSPPAKSGGVRQPGVVARPVAQTQESDSAQPADRASVELKNHINQEVKPLDPQLEDLLAQWSRASKKITRLEGEHLRLVYDLVYETEKRTRGKFYYEEPDKGRIELIPIEPTPELKQERINIVAKARADNRKPKVRTKLTKDTPPQPSDEPYELQAGQQELWCCDGQRVFSLDLAKKEAVVAQLPADMQGQNIMDSPLPFLFGMAPDKARRRFDLSFSRPFDPKSGYAHLKVLPRMKADQSSWVQADVILDLKQFLPVAVQLLDPAQTTRHLRAGPTSLSTPGWSAGGTCLFTSGL